MQTGLADLPFNDSIIAQAAERIIIPFFPTSITYMICPLFSFTAAGIVLVISLKQRIYKEPLGKMIIFLLLADFLFGSSKVIAYFGYIFGQRKSPMICSILNILSHTNLMCSFFWATLFGHAFYVIIDSSRTEVVKKYMKTYFFVAILLPILHSIGTEFTTYTVYDENTNTCIHTVVIGEVDWQYIFFTDTPLFICCCLSLYWYTKTVRRLKGLIANESGKELLTLGLYPAILIVCWGPMLVTSLMLSFGHRLPQWVTSTAQALGQLHGFFDAAVYGGSKKFARDLFKGLCRCWEKKKRNESESSNHRLTEDATRLQIALHEREESRLKHSVLDENKSIISAALLQKKTPSLLFS